MPFPAQPNTVRCPECQTPFVVDVRTIVDVGQEPELKDLFLRGEINHARCPNCGAGGLLSTSIVYHDPAKSFLAVYVPAELNLSASDQERVIGELVNRVMNGVPAEQRKAYFFKPKTVLTYNGLLEAVLEAEGLSPEVLRQQRAHMDIINALVEAMNDPEALNRIADEHKDEMTYEFFLLLSDLIDAQEEHSVDGEAHSLRTLRDRLLEQVSPAASQAAAAAAPAPATTGELIDELQRTLGEPGFEELVDRRLPLMDYSFFQELTGRLEAAEAAGNAQDADTLKALRQALLDSLERENRRLRTSEDEASLLIMDLLEAEDLDAAVSENEGQFGEAFFSVLARLRQAAQAKGNEARAGRLEALLVKARDAREEKLPPQVRLASRLLRADYPDESNDLLEADRALVNESLVRLFESYIGQFGQEIPEAARDRLDKIRVQIAAKVAILRP